MKSRQWLWLCVFAICSPGALLSQDTASLTGTVTDPSGAAISHATVSISNAEKGIKRTTPSNGSGDYVFAVVPGDAELDFKKLARASGVRKAEMAALKDVQPLTGYVRGGVTVFGAKKAYPAFADETIELFDVVSVSAGHRGVQIVLSPADYLRATGATLADLTKDTA